MMNKHDFLTQPHNFTRTPRTAVPPFPSEVRHDDDDAGDRIVGLGMAFILGVLAGMALSGAL
jgi:hypothetical protein